MNSAVLFLLGLLILSAGFAIIVYNSLVGLRLRVKNAWAQIDVQLKRRHDLIPNLVEVAKGYMAHERETLEKVVQARSQAIKVTDIKGKQQAENFLTSTLRSLFAVVERYPDLKANQNMLKLQEELTTTENKISFARQYYNDEVTRYNTSIQLFPRSVVASMFNFTKSDLFEIEDSSQKEAPKVKF